MVDLRGNKDGVQTLTPAEKQKEITAEQVFQDAFGSVVSNIRQKFDMAVAHRMAVENRLLNAYRNYRGLYGPNVQFKDPDQSQIFVKITKTKVIAAYGQLLDVLFGTGSFPIGVTATKEPIGIAEYAHTIMGGEKPVEEAPQEMPDIYGFEGDGRSIPPGSTRESLLNGLEEKYKGLPLASGPAPDKKQSVQIKPAEEAARKMEKVILDQLEETNATTAIRRAAFECVMLGTGILKGPMNYYKTYADWTKQEDGTRSYDPKEVLRPLVEHTSVWNFYPDPDGVNYKEWSWVIERHKMTRSDLRNLMDKPYFNAAAIRELLTIGPNYIRQSYENQLREGANVLADKDRFEVLEYWGTLDAKFADECGIELDDAKEEVDELAQIQVNLWVCGNKVIRAVLNPFSPYRLPYFLVPYEEDLYNSFGIGLAENMADSQDMMNGHARMAVDNLKLAGHVIFDVDETALVPGQDMKIYPGKIFRRSTGQPGQAVFGITIPNTAPANMAVFDKFRQLADEETGIPSYSHGAMGVTSTTRTASGMSMLMGAAALNIKTVVKNFDDYLLKPLGEAMFHWNMQFNEDDMEIRGDLEVQAMGTSALMRKEVRSQRLLTFMQVGQNPQLAPFIKWHTVLEELAVSLEMDPEDMIANPEEAALYAKIIGMQNANGTSSQGPASAGQQPSMGEAGGVPPGASPTDTSGAGAGNIGTGGVPSPGEAGFSAAGNPPTG